MNPSEKLPLLEVNNLSIAFNSRSGPLQVTRDLSFKISAGERVGLVGESGCGKTVTGLALMRLLDPSSVTITGDVLLQGRNLSSLSDKNMRSVRGREMAMIFQEPMSALDPVFTVGSQISEAFSTHFPDRALEAKERALDLLHLVGIPLPLQRYNEYPHQLSGGMLQRVMIAMGLICEPKILIADEPTTALDVTVQAQITSLLCDLSERTQTALLFITHDLGVVAETCTRMLVMYAGEVVEDAPIDDVLIDPQHPYTSGLLQSLPKFAKRHEPLVSIRGKVPALNSMPSGCRFQPRCDHFTPACDSEQTLKPIGLTVRQVRCCESNRLSLQGVSLP